MRKRYWGQRFWARGYFCTTSGNITDEVIMQYLAYYTAPIEKASATQIEPTGASR
ncbi:MAG: transposase [Sphingomonas sp.]